MNPEYKTLTHIPKFRGMVLQNFPYIEDDFDALTDYAFMSKIVEYLNNVIEQQNLVNDNTDALHQAYITLKNYVDNYFTNLDVQEEINNKLEDMAEDGTLTQLIGNYVQPLIDEQNIQLNSMQYQINSLENGSPLAASSTSEMTDTTKIYVNTTDGNWYYYNGTEWTVGGVYQSAVCDKFLSNLSTNAVENRVINKEFNNLSTLIRDDELVDTFDDWKRGALNLVNGEEIPIVTDDKIVTSYFHKIYTNKILDTLESGYKFRGVIYNEDGSYNSFFNWVTASGYAPLLQNIENKYIKIEMVKVDGTDISDDDIPVNDFLTLTNEDFYESVVSENDMIEYVNSSFIESNKKGVIFGDSIIEGVGILQANVVPTDDCVTVMKNILRADLYNGGVGGARLSDGSNSFVEVVNSIISGDWTQFNADIETLIAHNGNKFASLRQQYTNIEALNFSNVDLVGISYGTNDWTAGKLLDNPNNKMDTNTICGALRYTVSQLLTVYPNLRLYVFTPCYRYNISGISGTSSDTYVNPTSGLTLIEVGNAIEATCKELHIPCKNMYDVSNLNEYTRTYLMSDGTHRNKAGYKLLGNQYAKFISSN